MPFQPGFRGKPLPPAVWQQSAAFTINANGPNNAAPAGTRIFVPQSLLTITGGTKVRLTLNAAVPFAGGEVALNLDEVYFGQAAAGATSAAPSFAGTPTQVKFGGGNTCSVPLSQTIVTDEILVGLPTANGIILSAWSNRNYTVRHFAQASSFYSVKAGPSEASNVTVSGWSLFTNAIGMISKIEVFK